MRKIAIREWCALRVAEYARTIGHDLAELNPLWSILLWEIKVNTKAEDSECLYSFESIIVKKCLVKGGNKPAEKADNHWHDMQIGAKDLKMVQF